jgi:hypothetical protein
MGARIRVDSEASLEPEPVLIFDGRHKPFADIAMLELHPADAQAGRIATTLECGSPWRQI